VFRSEDGQPTSQSYERVTAFCGLVSRAFAVEKEGHNTPSIVSRPRWRAFVFWLWAGDGEHAVG